MIFPAREDAVARKLQRNNRMPDQSRHNGELWPAMLKNDPSKIFTIYVKLYHKQIVPGVLQKRAQGTIEI